MSLLEIIIVIVLIGAVLTLVASRVLGGADRGKANIAKAQVQTVASKVDNYQIDTGKLPGSLNDLVTAPAGVAGWLGPYAAGRSERSVGPCAGIPHAGRGPAV